eukprot:9211612-Alexandrium_andersonii.AAC.1
MASGLGKPSAPYDPTGAVARLDLVNCNDEASDGEGSIYAVRPAGERGDVSVAIAQLANSSSTA